MTSAALITITLQLWFLAIAFSGIFLGKFPREGKMKKMKCMGGKGGKPPLKVKNIVNFKSHQIAT